MEKIYTAAEIAAARQAGLDLANINPSDIGGFVYRDATGQFSSITATDSPIKDSSQLFKSGGAYDLKLSALKPMGNITFATLPALTEANLNTQYRVTDAFTTTADFIEGAGMSIAAGAYVAIMQFDNAYKYAVISSASVYGQVKSASGAIASFADGTAMPLKSLIAYINPIQAGSGDPSPDNIRPITGFTGTNITDTGKNFASTAFYKDGYILSSDGSETANADYFISTLIPIKRGESYCLSANSSLSDSIRMGAYDENMNFMYRTLYSDAVNAFTMPNDVYYVRFSFRKEFISSKEIQFELGSSRTAYQPFGTTYNVSWQTEAGTVYGGYLNVTTGKLIASLANIASYNGESINEPWISSMDAYVPGATPTTGAQVVYTLATPLEYDLTPIQIETLLEQNNIWVDTNGNTDVEYYSGSLYAVLPDFATKAELAKESDDLVNRIIVSALTKENYKAVMRQWFLANGANVMVDFRDLCNKWYEVTKTGWSGGTTFDQPSAGTSSFGTKIGDNAGLSCTPSTNATAEQDDYAALPLFYPIDCHANLDANGKVHITAIDGVIGSFNRYDTTKITAVMQMTPYIKRVDTATTFTWYYADHKVDADYKPWADAVELDRTVRNFVVHTKYNAGDGYTACAGQPLRVWDVSHNSQRTGIPAVWGNRYCGFTSADLSWLKMMFYIKYASKTGDGIMNGCFSYNYTYSPAVAETDVKRIILTTAQAANLLVGSTIILGTANDRNGANGRNVLNRKRIASIESVTIDGNTYAAVNIETDTAFTTATTQYMNTMQWYSGSTDDVKGNDGSPYSNTSTKEPYKMQGIEYMVGAWIVAGDIILNGYDVDGALYQKACVVRDATKIATSVTSDYIVPNFGMPKQASANWYNIASNGFDANVPELIFPNAVGGSSSTLTRDQYYLPSFSAGSQYEALLFGYLNYGLALLGVSTVSGNYALTSADWHIAGCVSLTGNRGELT